MVSKTKTECWDNVDTELIQLLAALANRKLRRRFASLSLANGPCPAVPGEDRLLIQSGVLRELSDGTVQIDELRLEKLLHFASSQREKMATPVQVVDRLPRRRIDRLSLLQKLASEVIKQNEYLSEAELGRRLETRAADVALIRRAMVDEGVLGRDAAGQHYWLLVNVTAQVVRP